jgi:Flp pilus assembly protein TadG
MSHPNRRFLAVRQDEAGGSLIESAFVLSVFLLLFFGAWDFAFMCYARATLQNAVRTAARYAITGNCNNPSGGCFTGTNPQDRLDTIVGLVTNYSFALSPTTVSVTCVQGVCSSSYGSGSNNAGGPGDLVQVTATYVYHPIIIDLIHNAPQTYSFSASSTFKNEQFQPSGS